MRVLGIDPGSIITGYGVVEKTGSRLLHIDNGCLTTKRNTPLPLRLMQIYDSLIETLDKFKPEAVVIEEVFFGKNIQSLVKLGESRGVALLAATKSGVAIYEYSTRVVKQAITGYGNATKEQIQKMIKQLLKLPEVAQEDASDALALAICHLNSSHLLNVQKGNS